MLNSQNFQCVCHDRHAWMHIFDRVCHEHEIEHRLTKVSHPWTNGQVKRMNRTLKEATVKRYYYDIYHQLKQHLYGFVNAYNFAKRLKTLKGLTPYEFIIQCWQKQPQWFKFNPLHHTTGLYTIHNYRSSTLSQIAFTKLEYPFVLSSVKKL